MSKTKGLGQRIAGKAKQAVGARSSAIRISMRKARSKRSAAGTNRASRANSIR
ncbi:hypothetical protein ACVWWO_001198 [Bradyrhizobium sp. F1.13.1]